MISFGRTGLDEGSLSALAEAGAFDSLGIDRRTALWDVRRLARTQKESLIAAGARTESGIRAVERLRRSQLGLPANVAQCAPPSARADARQLSCVKACPMRALSRR